MKPSYQENHIIKTLYNKHNSSTRTVLADAITIAPKSDIDVM